MLMFILSLSLFSVFEFSLQKESSVLACLSDDLMEWFIIRTVHASILTSFQEFASLFSFVKNSFNLIASVSTRLATNILFSCN